MLTKQVSHACRFALPLLKSSMALIKLIHAYKNALQEHLEIMIHDYVWILVFSSTLNLPGKILSIAFV